MLRYFSFLLLIVCGYLLTSTTSPDQAYKLFTANDDDKVQQLLRSLDEPQRGDIQTRPVKGASAELGEQIVMKGILQDGKRQSKHFVCTSCHNTVQENPDLLNTNPEARLQYAIDKDLPFLPGTTLFGAIDRESYYNDDYEKKYGDLVKPARKDLRAAIQLCATECAQGEALGAVEMESVIAYLGEIGLRLKDLGLNEAQKMQLNNALAGKSSKEAARKMLKSRYSKYSPATFVLPPEDRKKGYAEAGDEAIGAEIFNRSCMHCHGEKRYSFYDISETNDSYAHLLKHFPRYTRYSTYQVVRYGTSPIPGKRAYMPHYTNERMSNGQIESLRKYLEMKVAKK